jgi:hypothetical protein
MAKTVLNGAMETIVGAKMALPLTLRVLLLSTAASLLAYFAFPIALITLAKLLALSLAMTLLLPVVYPHLRGVRRGDMVMAINPPQRAGMLQIPIPFLQFGGGTFMALDSGRIGSRVRVSMPDSTWRDAEIVSYSGFLQPARVRLLESQYTSINVL